MCLGVPGRIIEMEGLVATVDFWGVQREVRLDVVDEPVAPGDYVLNHVGYAIRRIPEAEIGETLALYELLIEEAERADAMAEDVRGEIEATGRVGGDVDVP
jgi:hydrogenase expression/formation protein HypC